MASKILVKIPVTPFGHMSKSKTAAMPATTSTANDSHRLISVVQLEQNVRFLQEQHQLMLKSLHEEVESLRQRNRDLQFQLVFSKGSVVQSSSSIESSPETDLNTTHKSQMVSPKQSVNMTPLQVELLERELSELRTALHEMETKNVYLTGIVNEQKKQIERYEKETNETVRPNDSELLNKLDDVESLVRKLRLENDELRRSGSTSQPARSGGGSGGRHRGGHYRGHRFPPLHPTQTYWQQTRKNPNNLDGNVEIVDDMSLPNLQQQSSNGYRYHNSGRRTSNNNHHHNHHHHHNNHYHLDGNGSGSGNNINGTGVGNNSAGGANTNRKYRPKTPMS